ncbi:nodulation protein NfeD [candidate division KSB1 bacterium]|nr:nodulation protein NfeD [candidate division KSB1 bacterium]
MKTKIIIIVSLVFLLFQGINAGENQIMQLKIKGVIGPVTSEYLIKNFKLAQEENYHAILIEMDTPGGLVSSTKDIVSQMLQSPVPLIVYVHPVGAGAISAGSFIMLAAHFAIMTPNTTVGAAHPISLGMATDTSDVMNQKATNYLGSYIKNIAENRGKNAEAAQKMVIESAAYTAEEALTQNLIDGIVPNLDSLLIFLDGKGVKVDSGQIILKTREATIVPISMTWRQTILQTISNPNIAYLFILIGLLGLYFEFSHPGTILPGIIGAFCLIIGFYATEVLTINWAGFLLLILAFILFLMEIKITSYGLLTVGGIISMIIGSLMLFKAPIPLLKISWSLVITASITISLFFIFAVGMALRAQRRKVTTGQEGLIGEQGKVVNEIPSGHTGLVEVHGEIWHATSTQTLIAGEKVIINAVNGLLLSVEKLNS